MADSDAMAFTRSAAARIANAVRLVEIGERAGGSLEFDQQPLTRPAKTFRLATFTGSWAVNELKTVTFKNQTTTPNTVIAINLVLGMSPSGSCDVSIAKDKTSWYVVQPNFTQLPMYAAAGTQVMGIVDGYFQWISVAACSTAAT